MSHDPTQPLNMKKSRLRTQHTTPSRTTPINESQPILATTMTHPRTAPINESRPNSVTWGISHELHIYWSTNCSYEWVTAQRITSSRLSSCTIPSWCVAVCCSVCCSELQWVACPDALFWTVVVQYNAVCCSVMQCVAVCCSVLQRAAACCSVW